jgi:[acyl-carrier-protein] S-malonyltransferase
MPEATQNAIAPEHDKTATAAAGPEAAPYVRVQTHLLNAPYHSRPRRKDAPMTPSLAFVFPGQGSQSLGMLADLAAAHPLVRQTFDEASAGCGIDLWSLAQGGPEEQLNQTEFTQPALLAANVAVWRAWLAAGGAQPAQLAGHSLGEYAALVAAGALSLADGARLVRERGRLMQAAVPAGTGAMAAVLGTEDAVVEEVCAAVASDEVVVPANFNSPGQVVIGGHADAIDRAIAEFAARGVRKVVKLAVSVPSHTPLMREAAEQLSAVMESVQWSMPDRPVIQNADAIAHASVHDIRDALARQLYLPVRWTDCVRALAAGGATRLLECGPGKVLAGLTKRIDKALEARALGNAADFDAALTENT